MNVAEPPPANQPILTNPRPGMPFQFTCPEGHLLEGEAAHAGMQSQCPMCGVMFIIPQPPPGLTPGDQASGFGGSEGEPFSLSFGPPPHEPQPPVAGGDGAAGAAPATGSPLEEDPDRIVHILCPNGHELETPMSMVGTDAMCPHCEVAFRLRYEDSLEYREQKRKEREHREAVFGRKALNFAIVTAVLVLLGLIGLMIFAASQ